MSTLNSHADIRLTKEGGFSFDVWLYVLELEMKAHASPVGEISPEDWRAYYDDNHTPHDAIEEDFDAGR